MKPLVPRGLLAASLLAAAAVHAAPRATPVTAAVVQSVEWPDQLSAQGTVAAWQEAVVASRVPGVAVIEINVAVGEHVKRGALLAKLDDRSLQAEYQGAQADHERARVALLQAETEASRSDTLHARGLVSERQLLSSQTTRDLARAQLKIAEANCGSLRVKLDDTKVFAPDDGLITARGAVLGQVPAQGAELFRMIRQNRLEWRAELGPEQMTRLYAGVAVALQLPDGKQARGQLRQLAGALEPSNRLGLAYVDLLPGSTAKAGMVASGRFDLAPRVGLVVQAEAVQVRDGRAVVFRVTKGKARQVTVQTGRRQGVLVEVFGGVRAGEQVVVQGAGFLRDGEAVQVVEIAKARQS